MFNVHIYKVIRCGEPRAEAQQETRLPWTQLHTVLGPGLVLEMGPGLETVSAGIPLAAFSPSGAQAHHVENAGSFVVNFHLEPPEFSSAPCRCL